MEEGTEEKKFKDMYIQVILNPRIPAEKELIDYRNNRYGHIGNKALVIELLKKDMEEKKAVN